MSFRYDFPHKHLLGIEGLNRLDIESLLDRADGFVENKSPEQSLVGKTLINLFFENSTRTQSSFDISAKRLGADVVNMSVQSSSVKKGETLIDTAMTLNAMAPDLLVIRHGASGAVRLLSRKVDCAVVNAGDGTHEHPTQALLDALTILRRKGRIEGLKVAICGDILHSRVARSNAMLLHQLGAEVRLIAPPTLLPPGTDTWGAASVHTDMLEGIKDCDVVMMLRLQLERMHGLYLPSKREFFHFYGLDKAKLAHAAPGALIMHPGPMNRGVEIDSAITESANSTITEQVSMGVFVRMAVLEVLAQNLDRARAEAKA
ncbi:aspartate carbamoyltransferase catalytic subunit [Ponticaulis sp.]|uniref:aspartate carbamoyltransferase catalytic subunit n=1 Tax=Ponticaulis sp. TaxID=2020902 RepID=UPI000B6C5431|nr:aspartate carbamoyltransferase catalytic subunit [Ponticaulis sp.]MAI91966.1 aspartate carbamoyltransferase catalytic subunit [Ponticaulis sp.]OUX96437.1 MAG: aspartate carbamoyltransferase [Hyphomonadaceae bacterium TMED5]|tara:strand:- start:43531 stop:44481 length:951 start_codon:yes stop_codon:yes gene_type:complete